MDKSKPDFKRMLVRLPHSPCDYTAVALIADLAGLLGADLIGTFLDDNELRSVADIPDAREFRAGSWQPLNSKQFALALASASREAEHLFLKCAGQHSPSFSVIENKDQIAQDYGQDDIIVVIEPKSPIERATRQFGELLEHASRSMSSILWVPNQAKHIAGPVMVITTGPDDAAISAALAIAASTKERIILLSSGASTDSLAPVMKRANKAGVAATLMDAVFHGDELLLPANINTGLLVAGRGDILRRRTRPQIPVLLVSPRLQSTSQDAQP